MTFFMVKQAETQNVRLVDMLEQVNLNQFTNVELKDLDVNLLFSKFVQILKDGYKNRIFEINRYYNDEEGAKYSVSSTDEYCLSVTINMMNHMVSVGSANKLLEQVDKDSDSYKELSANVDINSQLLNMVDYLQRYKVLVRYN